jgi:hypothetical protein
VTFIALLLLPGPALAQGPAEPSPSPAVDQYRESVPTARGAKPSSRGGRAKRTELSPAVEREIAREAGADARDLEDIATDPGLGAPSDAPAGARGARERADAAARAGDVPDRSLVPAAVDAVGDGSGAMVLLLLGLAGTTGVLGAVAFARRGRPAP